MLTCILIDGSRKINFSDNGDRYLAAVNFVAYQCGFGKLHIY